MNSNSGQKNTPFNKLLNDNWDYVFNYILKKTSDDYIAEEITIQTFSKAFQKINRKERVFFSKKTLEPCSSFTLLVVTMFVLGNKRIVLDYKKIS